MPAQSPRSTSSVSLKARKQGITADAPLIQIQLNMISQVRGKNVLTKSERLDILREFLNLRKEGRDKNRSANACSQTYMLLGLSRRKRYLEF